MVGKWSMYVLKSLRIGDGETNVRGVTEKVHRLQRRSKDKGGMGKEAQEREPRE